MHNSFTRRPHIGTINTATTGATQTAGNNSTLIATTAYADAAAAAGGGNFLPLAGGTMTGDVIFPGEEANSFKIAFTGASASSGLSTVDQSGAGLYIGANSRVNNSGVVVFHDTLLPSSGIYFDGWSGDDMEFYTGSSGNPTKRLTIEAGGDAIFTGNVGIGTTNPIDELHVEGVIQSKKQLLPSTSGTAGWYKIGTLESFVQGGSTAVIEIVGHVGYNATNTQDYLIKLFIKTSNGTGSGPQLQKYNSWYERTGGNADSIELKWDNSATDDYDLYMLIPIHSLRSYYSVTKGTGTWVNAGTSATDPGVNSASVLEATGLFNILDTNVGIGTASPSNGKLVINSAANQIAIETGTSGDGRLNIGHFANGAFIGTYGDDAGAADIIRFGTHSGDERMRINSAGSVGIGTTSPGAKLTVSGTGYYSNQLTVDGFTNDAGISFRDGFTPTNTGIRAKAIGTANRDGVELLGYNGIDFSVNNGANVAMRIVGVTGTGVGNVGIGTTAPSAKLQIVDTTSRTGTTASLIVEGRQDGAANVLTLRSKDYSAPAVGIGADHGPIMRWQGFDGTDFENMGYIFVGADGQTIANADAPSYMSFGTSGDGSSTPTERMRITSTGNVGIGTTAPKGLLEVSGINPIIVLQDNDGAVDKKYRYFQNSENKLFFSRANDAFNSYSTDMVIDATGNVGINTTSPNEKLQVVGNVQGGGVDQASNKFNTSAIFRGQNDGAAYINLIAKDDANSGVLLGVSC